MRITVNRRTFRAPPNGYTSPSPNQCQVPHETRQSRAKTKTEKNPDESEELSGPRKTDTTILERLRFSDNQKQPQQQRLPEVDFFVKMSRRKRVENATRAWGQRCSKSIALAVSVSLGFSCVQINAEGLLGVSETLAGPCASDSDVTGFSSLVQLNSEMRRHALLISLPDHEPLPEYTYRLCPQSVFDGSQQIQVPPQLFPYDPTIKCGNSGDAAESCNINGGVTQVFMMDSAGSALDADSATSREPTTGSFSFEGLTFTNSQDLSIAAMMSSPLAIAQFTDCHWKVSQRQRQHHWGDGSVEGECTDQYLVPRTLKGRLVFLWQTMKLSLKLGLTSKRCWKTRTTSSVRIDY